MFILFNFLAFKNKIINLAKSTPQLAYALCQPAKGDKRVSGKSILNSQH